MLIVAILPNITVNQEMNNIWRHL